MSKDWVTKRLDDACEVEYGTRVVNKRDGGTIYPVYGGGSATFFMDSFNRENCLVVARFAMSEQCTRYVDGKFFLNDSGLTVSPKNKNEILQYFLNLQMLYLNDHIYSLARGTAQKNLDVPAFRNIEISYPPLPEQKRIVAILNEAFAAIDKAKENTEKNLQNAKELFQSELNSIFCHRHAFGENKGKGWEEKLLGEIARVSGGYSFKSSDFKKSGKYQVLRMGNVRPGVIRIEENPVFVDTMEEKALIKCLLKPGDVIITQTGTKHKRDYGYTAIIDKTNFLLNQRIASIRFPSDYLAKFFLYFSWTNLFKDQYFANETGTVGQGNVGIGAVTDALIPFCSIEEQKNVVQRIDTFMGGTKKLEAIYQQKLNALDELKKSILEKAFAGGIPSDKGELKTAKAEMA